MALTSFLLYYYSGGEIGYREDQWGSLKEAMINSK